MNSENIDKMIPGIFLFLVTEENEVNSGGKSITHLTSEYLFANQQNQ